MRPYIARRELGESTQRLHSHESLFTGCSKFSSSRQSVQNRPIARCSGRSDPSESTSIAIRFLRFIYATAFAYMRLRLVSARVFNIERTHPVTVVHDVCKRKRYNRFLLASRSSLFRTFRFLYCRVLCTLKHRQNVIGPFGRG